MELAESLSPITKKIDESTKKISEVIKQSNSGDDIKALPNSSKISNSMQETIGSLMNSRNSLKITQEESSRANILDVPIQISGADTKKNKKIYESTPEIHKALSSTTYTGRTEKKEDDILMMSNFIDLGYTGTEDRQSNRKTFFQITLPKLVDEIQNKTFDEITLSSDDLQGEGVKNIILSNVIDIYTRVEILLGLKLSGHTDALTEASNLIGEVRKKQQYRNAPNKFSTL